MLPARMPPSAALVGMLWPLLQHSPFLLWLGTGWHPGKAYSRLPPCGLMRLLRDYYCSWWVPGVPAFAEGPLGQSRMWGLQDRTNRHSPIPGPRRMLG